MSAVPITRMPPRGHYFAHEVGRLAGVSGDRIGQWARRGYIKSSQSNGRPRVYSFQDIAEAMVVHELIQRGVDMSDIKATLGDLYETYGDWPLSVAPLKVADYRRLDPSPEGKRRKNPRSSIVVEEGGTLYHGGGRGQTIIEPASVQRIVADLRRGGWAVRVVPTLKHIEVDPDRLSGAPVIKGSRVSAEFAATMAETPEGRTVLRRDYDLSTPQIEDARKWWQAVSKFEQTAA